MIWKLPLVNACLNALSFSLQMLGLFFILRKNRKAHKVSMLLAAGVSVLFLTGYLYFHSQAGSIKFGGEGAIRTFYFILLISHSIFAAAMPILVPVTIVMGLRSSPRHRKIARYTLPIWAFVSVTGVMVFLMLLPYYPVSPI